MDSLETQDLTIELDEPAFNLKELHLSADDFKKLTGHFPPGLSSGKRPHRFQGIQVVRGDRLVTWWKDLGAAENFDADQVHIPGGQIHRDSLGTIVEIEIWHTVGELVDHADAMRGAPSYIAEIEPTPLGAAWTQVIEDRPGLAVKRSSFGYGGVRINNGASNNN